jgi:subtilisin-like proprotein convertase family protein
MRPGFLLALPAKQLSNHTMPNLSILCMGILCLFLPAFVQSQIWADHSEAAILPTGERQIVPTAYRTLRADTVALQDALRQAPHESETPLHESTARLEIPLPDGNSEVFAIVQYDMMEPGLAERYPGIRTYRGRSLRSPGRTVYLDWTLRGFHAMIAGPDAVSVYMDPYSTGDVQHYVAYYKSDYPAPALPFVCHVEDPPKGTFAPDGAPKLGDCVFRSYRLAMATTGEYSNYHGATSSAQSGLVLSAVTTAVNRVNQVYARDIAVRMVLIANTTSVFYYNPATDPFTNNSGGTMLNENQTNMTAVIGAANYDIGHVFSTGGGGVARLRSPCTVNFKAQGVTGLPNPIGDPFYIDYVAHEMGHQFGANHTQNNDCNRVAAASYEPGSGSTIMSYAGICPPNVQGLSNDYLHAISMQEIAAFVTGATGNSCATPILSPNNPPTVTPALNYTIPHSTPFVLTAAASDPNGHPLSYCWEQWDPQFATMPPQSANTSGPAFRTFSPNASPSRYFPRLQDLVNNVSPTWEVLPSVARDLNFRVTVRDDNGAYSCTTETNTTLTVNGSAGPFVVTQPNTAVSWEEGQTYTVAWNVAGTAAAPVSCASVDILLSYDGGFTYPVVLLANTPNDGSQNVVVPAGTSATARVMVRCSGNVFFDISNVNFNITPASAPDYTIQSAPETIITCDATAQYTIQTGSLGGYNSPITLSLTGLPAGANYSFMPNPVSPGNPATLTLSNLTAVVPGSYFPEVQASSNSGNKTVAVELVVQSAPVAAQLATPADMAAGQSVRPDLSWNADVNAATYEGQIATDPAFTNIVRSFSGAATSYSTTGVLLGSTTYYWRIRGLSACATGPWSAGRSFTTGSCVTFNSTDVPKFISDGPPNTVNSTLVLSEPGAVISDLNVVNLAGTHTWMADLTFQLISPDNTTVTLFGGICGNLQNFNLNLDQEAAPGAFPCPPTTGLTYQPSGNLNSMVGKDLSGSWTLRVIDAFNLDGGSLDSWGLNVCLTGFSAPLPVELLHFEAQPAGKSVRLQWATASERNNAGFEVERSDRLPTDFQPIAWMAGKGDSQAENNYSLYDAAVQPGQTYYYRLRQLDYDGQESYSPVRAVRLAGDLAEIQAYPNPAGNELFIKMPAAADGASLEVFDAQGKLMARESCSGPEHRIDTSRWPQGYYTLRVAVPAFTGVTRVAVRGE